MSRFTLDQVAELLSHADGDYDDDIDAFVSVSVDPADCDESDRTVRISLERGEAVEEKFVATVRRADEDGL